MTFRSIDGKSAARIAGPVATVMLATMIYGVQVRGADQDRRGPDTYTIGLFTSSSTNR